jgi:hypothetical protein
LRVLLAQRHPLDVLLVGEILESRRVQLGLGSDMALSRLEFLPVLVDEQEAEGEEHGEFETVANKQRADAQGVFGRLVGLVEERLGISARSTVPL